MIEIGDVSFPRGDIPTSDDQAIALAKERSEWPHSGSVHSVYHWPHGFIGMKGEYVLSVSDPERPAGQSSHNECRLVCRFYRGERIDENEKARQRTTAEQAESK